MSDESDIWGFAFDSGEKVVRQGRCRSYSSKPRLPKGIHIETPEQIAGRDLTPESKRDLAGELQFDVGSGLFYVGKKYDTVVDSSSVLGGAFPVDRVQKGGLARHQTPAKKPYTH